MEKLPEMESMDDAGKHAAIRETILAIMEKEKNTRIRYPWIHAHKNNGIDTLDSLWSKTADHVYYDYDFWPDSMDAETLVEILGRIMDTADTENALRVMDWDRQSETYGLAIPAEQMLQRALRTHSCVSKASWEISQMRSDEYGHLKSKMETLLKNRSIKTMETPPKQYVPLNTHVMDTKTGAALPYPRLWEKGVAFTRKIPVDLGHAPTKLRSSLENCFGKYPGLPGRILGLVLEECAQGPGEALKEHLLDSILGAILCSAVGNGGD